MLPDEKCKEDYGNKYRKGSSFCAGTRFLSLYLLLFLKFSQRRLIISKILLVIKLLSIGIHVKETPAARSHYPIKALIKIGRTGVTKRREREAINCMIELLALISLVLRALEAKTATKLESTPTV